MPDFDPIVAPAPASPLAGVRRFLRWSLLIGFTIGMATWMLSYACSNRQLVTAFVGFLLWFAFGCAGCMVKVVEVARAFRRRHFWGQVLPGWGSLLWLAAPILYLASNACALDAVVWFTQHRGRLEHHLRDGPPFAGALAWRAEPGITVQIVAPGIVLFEIGGGWEARGIAHDPGGRLTAGVQGGPAGYLVRVTDLDDGWRAWSRGD